MQAWVTRANHGVDNRIGAHAKPPSPSPCPHGWGWVTLIVEQESICRHEAAYRAHEPLFAFLLFLHPAIAIAILSSSPPSPGMPCVGRRCSKRRVSAFSRYGNTYRYYRHVARRTAAEIEYEIQRGRAKYTPGALLLRATSETFRFLSGDILVRLPAERHSASRWSLMNNRRRTE